MAFDITAKELNEIEYFRLCHTDKHLPILYEALDEMYNKIEDRKLQDIEFYLRSEWND